MARVAVVPLVVVSGSQQSRFGGSNRVRWVRRGRWGTLGGPAEEAAPGSQSKEGVSRTLSLSHYSLSTWTGSFSSPSFFYFCLSVRAE